MEKGDIIINLKVKIYSTNSSLDVQGTKPHYSTEFEALGNRTIGVYFAEVVMEAIFQCMMNKCDLNQYNEYCRTQLNIGLAGTSNQELNKNQDGKVKKSSKKVVIEVKCNICETNTKELNSFKCHECSQPFHK